MSFSAIVLLSPTLGFNLRFVVSAILTCTMLLMPLSEFGSALLLMQLCAVVDIVEY